MHSTGFWVPCTVCASSLRPAICHSVVCLRSPDQWPWPPNAPGVAYDQQKAMEQAARLDWRDDNYCLRVRLAEQAVKAVKEVVSRLRANGEM